MKGTRRLTWLTASLMMLIVAAAAATQFV